MPCVPANCSLFVGNASTTRNRKCTYSRPRTKGRFGLGARPRRVRDVCICRRNWRTICGSGNRSARTPRLKAFIFPDAKGGFMDTGNYRRRVLHKLAKDLDLPKLTFQVIRRTIATLAQKKGTVKDVQGLLRHSRAATTTDVYMQEIPESVQATVNAINAELRVKPEEKLRRLRMFLKFATKCYQPIG